MRVVVQRVISSSVTIDGQVVSSIGRGLMILCGFEEADGDEDIEWMCSKIARLRIFDDASGVMNLSVVDADCQLMVVSQFTLMASTRKGNRPSYVLAAKPDISIPLYENFKARLALEAGREVHCGVFGADMKVSLINDGPVTICIDSKNRQ